VHGALLLELLGQVVESLQAADLGEQPLLVALLHLVQALPGVGDVLVERESFGFVNVLSFFPPSFLMLNVCFWAHRHHLALGGHEGGPVAQPQLGLQGVEVDLQLALLLHAGRLVDAAVVPEVLQLLLHGAHGLLRRAVLQPRDGAVDPLQQLGGETLIVRFYISGCAF